jgi:hypothetical protein
MVANINDHGIRENFRFGKAEASESAFDQENETLSVAAKDKLHSHFDTSSGVRFLSPNNPQALQEATQALDELKRDLLKTKSSLRQATESTVNWAAQNRIARFLTLGQSKRLAVGTFQGSYTTHSVNSENPLFNDTETLDLVFQLAKLPDTDSSVPPGLRDKARSVLQAWTKTSLRLNTKIGKDSTDIKSNENRTDTALDAIQQIMTADHKATRLRGVATIVELAAKNGGKDESLDRYLDRIEASFDLVGSGVAEIVRREIKSSVSQLDQIKTKSAEYMDEDPTVIRDLSKAVGKLAFGHIKKNAFADKLQAFLDTEPETRSHDKAKQELFNVIESYTKQYNRYSDLEGKYEEVQARLNGELGEYAITEFEFMTEGQLKEVFTRNGEAYDSAKTRSENAKDLEAVIGANSAPIEVNIENVEIAGAAKADANKKVKTLEKEINKLTEPVSKSLRNFPELADSISQMIGYRFGFNLKKDDQGRIARDQDDIFEGILTKQEEEKLEKKFERKIKAQISRNEAQIASFEAQLQQLDTSVASSRQAMLDYAKAIGLDDDAQRQVINAQINSAVSHRHNSKLEPASIALSKTPSSDDDLINMATKIVDFAEQEIISDLHSGRTPLRSTPGLKTGFNGASSPDYDTLVDHSRVLDNKVKMAGEFETRVESLRNEIESLKDPDNKSSKFKDFMAEEFEKKFKTATNFLASSGIINPSRIEEAQDAVRSSSAILESNPQFFQSSETGESLISALRSLLNYLLEPIMGGIKKGDSN